MTNKFKYGEVVLIKNGKGKSSNQTVKNKLGIVKEKEYYYKDYYVEVFLDDDDWFNEKDIVRAIERLNGKTKKYDVMIVSTQEGIEMIHDKLKHISKNNKWDKINLIKRYSSDNRDYCLIGWNNTYWPFSNKSVEKINEAIRGFRKKDIPYKYLIVGKNIDIVLKKEFIENDSNVDILNISIDIKI